MPQTQRGQAYRLGDGRWGLRFYDEGGKRRRVSPFLTKSAALKHFRWPDPRSSHRLRRRSGRAGEDKLQPPPGAALPSRPCRTRPAPRPARPAAPVRGTRGWVACSNSTTSAAASGSQRSRPRTSRSLPASTTCARRSPPTRSPPGVTVFELAKIMCSSVRMIERHYGALLDGAGAGISGRLDALEAQLQQDAEAGGS
jgi:hypothetical protein